MTSSPKPPELDITKSGGGLVRGDKHKTNPHKRRSLPFLWIWLMTSSLYPPELDIPKSGGGSPWGDKHKMNMPERRFLPFWSFHLMTSSLYPPELDIAKSLSDCPPHAYNFKIYSQIHRYPTSHAPPLYRRIPYSVTLEFNVNTSIWFQNDSVYK